MTDRQTQAVADAIAASIYRSMGLETMNYAGIEDYCIRERSNYEGTAKAAIAASDAHFLPMVATVLRVLSKKPIATWYSGPNGENGYYAGWDDAEYAVRNALSRLPEDLK